MKNITTLLSIATLVLVGVLVYVVSANKPEQPPITVGAILPLTGDLSFVGMQMQRGMELALEDYPDAGIKLVYEDDHTLDKTASLNAVNKLISYDHASIILNDAVNTIKALAPTLEREKIPGVVFWDSNEELKGLGDHVFGMGYSTESAGADMADFAYNTLGVRTVWVISAQDEWSKITSDAFVKRFKELGGTIHGHEQVTVDYTDFRTNVAKAKQADSDALYFPLFPQANDSLVRKARELGYTGQLLSGDGFIDENIANLGPLSEGVYASLPLLIDPSFSKKYQQKYGEEMDAVNLAFAGLGYDAVKMVVDVTRLLRDQGIPVNSETIHDALPGFTVSGVLGTRQFSSEGIADQKESILVVQDGKFEPAWKR